MKYMGSKRRIAKHILPIILDGRKRGQAYVEPFVGGCNMIDKVDGWRIGADSHYYLIKLWRAVQNGWIPKDNYTEAQYNMIKRNPQAYPEHIVGYFGFALSFGARWLGTWRKDKNNDCVGEAYRSAIKQFKKLKGVEFYNCPFDALIIPNKALVYCDPPYRGTYKYNGTKYDSNRFWSWCRRLVNQGHTVFVSEYEAPSDFKCVWSQEINAGFNQKKYFKKAVEKLFTKRRPKIMIEIRATFESKEEAIQWLQGSDAQPAEPKHTKAKAEPVEYDEPVEAKKPKAKKQEDPAKVQKRLVKAIVDFILADKVENMRKVRPLMPEGQKDVKALSVEQAQAICLELGIDV